MSELQNEFIVKIESRTARIAVIGLGYVGLPLLLGFQAKGFSCLGVDIDQAKVDALTAGKSYIQHIADDRIAKMVKSGRLETSTDFAKLKNADAIIICVPTPLTKHLEPDLSYVVSTCETIAPHLKVG